MRRAARFPLGLVLAVAALVGCETSGSPEDAPGCRSVETLGRVDPGPTPHQRADPIGIASDGGPAPGPSGRARAARTER